MMRLAAAITLQLAIAIGCGPIQNANSLNTHDETTQKFGLLAMKHGATGSFVVTVGGSPWLHSGELKIHVNDEWHAMHPQPAPAPPAVPPHCTARLEHTDQIGGAPVGKVSNTTDASCCASCLAHKQCDTWVRATSDRGDGIPKGACFLLVGASRVHFQHNITSRNMGFVDGHPRSIPSTVATGRITSADTPTTTSSGRDWFGEYEKTSWHWLAEGTHGKPTVPFTTSILVYASGHSAVFEQSIPGGAKQTNYSPVALTPTSSDQVLPFMHFPSFNTSHPDGVYGTTGRAGFVTWRGTMVPQQFGKDAPQSVHLGLSGGPVVVHEGLSSGGSSNALMVSPATHFKGAVQLREGDNWAIGVSGEVEEVPEGFMHRTLLVAGGSVTQTMDKYGELMRRAYRTNKTRDAVVEKVGYWTDNGAYYYGDPYQTAATGGPPHWQGGYDYNLTCCTKSKLLAAKHALDKDNVPINYLQLDDWWYHGAHPVKNFSGVKCVDKWDLPADTYGPGGLTALRKDYMAPFLLYGPYFCTENQFNLPGEHLIPDGADAGLPHWTVSEQFYTRVFDYLKMKGGIGYEVDFMSELYLGIPEFRRTLDAATMWQQGLNKAAAQKKVPVQFCMMQPDDILNTLFLDQVTNGRASGDYAGNGNWNLGGSSLLYWALGIRPSKDNFWSGDEQPRELGLSQPNPGSNGELNAILATMSTGPVGPSDGAGNHNTTRLMRTCDAVGNILQPNKPMTPIDATYRAILSTAERPIPAAAVWQTYSHADGLDADVASYQYHLLGVDVDNTSELPVMRDDFYPAIDADIELIVRDWHRSGPCVNGSHALNTNCVKVVSGASSTVVTMGAGFDWPHKSPPEYGADWHTTQLYTVAQSDGGFVMLGELDKFTSVSSARFSKLQTSATSIKASLRGGAGELVHLTAISPSKMVVTADVTIGAAGTAEVVIT